MAAESATVLEVLAKLFKLSGDSAAAESGGGGGDCFGVYRGKAMEAKQATKALCGMLGVWNCRV